MLRRLWPEASFPCPEARTIGRPAKQAQSGNLRQLGGTGGEQQVVYQTFGGLIPKDLNLSWCVTGSTIASTSSWICLSRPPTSE